MRAYFFGNIYLSSIQQSIQGAHALTEMFLRYPNPNGEVDQYLWEWAKKHKTMILLNAGYSENIRNIVKLFRKRKNPYPWAQFHEGKDALDGALTSVGIILPEHIYDCAAKIRDRSKPEITLEYVKVYSRCEDCVFTKWETQLIETINKFGMAS